MELWTGVDAVEIGRIAKSMRREGFLQRYFGPEELEYFASRGNAPQTVAGHFAAKEAFSKAMGTGIRGFALKEVGIVHDRMGRPSFLLSGAAGELCGARRLSLSITHTGETATAFVVAWEE